MNTSLQEFAEHVVARHDEHLLDHGPDEQIKQVTEKLKHFAKTTPLVHLTGKVVDFAGFCEVPLHFDGPTDKYWLLSDGAAGTGWPIHKAVAWAEKAFGYAVEEQRRMDEERGDGRLGYDLMRDYLDLGVNAIVDDPEAKPDAGGHRWSHSGDWLISCDRISDFLASGPWGKEFMDNSMDAFRHAAREIFGDKLRQSPVHGPDGTPTGQSAYDLFEPRLSKEEALRRARRGPAFDEDGDGR